MKELVIRSTICLTLQTKNKQQLTSEDWTPILMWNKLFCSLETKAICILDRKRSQEGTGKQRAGPSSPASAVPASTAPPSIPWDHSYLRYMQVWVPFHPDPSTPIDWEQKLTACAHKTRTISSKVHPNGFIFSPKTYFNPSNLLLQIFLTERTGHYFTHWPPELAIQQFPFVMQKLKQPTVTKI